MSIFPHIKGVLMAEKKQNEKAYELHSKEVSELPRGTVIIKKTKSGEYFYLNYYCNETKKSVFKYIGKDKAVVSPIQQQIERRKYLEKTLKILEKDLEAIEKMLRISNERIRETRSLEQTEENPTDQLNTRESIKEIQKHTNPFR